MTPLEISLTVALGVLVPFLTWVVIQLSNHKARIAVLEARADTFGEAVERIDKSVQRIESLLMRTAT